MNETILCIGAHSDDIEIGMGATIAKYVKEGKKVIGITFSFGEGSNPLMKEDIVIRQRLEEVENVSKLLGIKDRIFIGLPDGKMMKHVDDKEIIIRIENLIEKYKPNKIFTHADNDPHSDHRAVMKIVLKAVDNLKKDYEVFTFDVWNPFNIFRSHKPKMYIDVSDTFEMKIKALKLFTSQKFQGAYSLMPIEIFKSIVYGWIYNCKYAEKFFKVR